MDDIVAFLTARLDADERAARICTPGHERWQAFPMDDIAGCSVYDDQWRLLSGTWYDHNNPMSNKPNATGPAYIDTDRIMEHVARHDPARVLADVAAKRAILNRAVRMVDSFNAATDAPWPDASRRERSHAVETIHDLAAPYDGHPDFDPAWRVT